MTIVLGAGISGLAAGYRLNQLGKEFTIVEQESEWGGLCGNFEISGFRFDKAIHLSFTEDAYVKNIFSKSSDFFVHKPLAYNYYNGFWLKHPAQNNLYPLNSTEKIEIINDFIENKNKKSSIRNYDDWLRAQYGDYFSEHFPIPYTRKYWTYEASDLSTTWVGNRMYRPDIKEVLWGAFEDKTPNTYYAKEMRYPKDGGYKSFLRSMANACEIKTEYQVQRIDIDQQEVRFGNGQSLTYTNLISSIPLPEYAALIDSMPSEVKKACETLQYTSVALVSIGLNKPDIPKHLWFYIYDEDILASRCYSPSLKSPDNAPHGCSSFQFEIYFSNNRPLRISGEDLIQHIIDKSEKMKILDKRDIVVTDFRVLKYGNVIFNHGMEKNRKIVLDYLESIGIKTIGRFGKWEYLWSDQSLKSGVDVASI